MKTLPKVKIESGTFSLPCPSYNAVRTAENAAADELAAKCNELARLQEESWAVATTDPTRNYGGIEK